MKAKPGFDEALESLRDTIFSTLNCVQIGKISSFDKDTQTASIEIAMRAQRGKKVITYPLLVDCPVIILQGGGSYLEFPISSGDYCLVLFNDRDIDTWWSSENIAPPRTGRKHSLSDGFALVGLNPSTSVLDLSGDRVKLKGNGLPVEVEGTEVKLNGDSKSLVTHGELDQALQLFITALNLHVHGTAGTPPVTPMSINIASSATTTVKTGG